MYQRFLSLLLSLPLAAAFASVATAQTGHIHHLAVGNFDRIGGIDSVLFAPTHKKLTVYLDATLLMVDRPPQQELVDPGLGNIKAIDFGRLGYPFADEQVGLLDTSNTLHIGQYIRLEQEGFEPLRTGIRVLDHPADSILFTHWNGDDFEDLVTGHKGDEHFYVYPHSGLSGDAAIQAADNDTTPFTNQVIELPLPFQGTTFEAMQAIPLQKLQPDRRWLDEDGDNLDRSALLFSTRDEEGRLQVSLVHANLTTLESLTTTYKRLFDTGGALQAILQERVADYESHNRDKTLYLREVVAGNFDKNGVLDLAILAQQIPEDARDDEEEIRRAESKLLFLFFGSLGLERQVTRTLRNEEITNSKYIEDMAVVYDPYNQHDRLLLLYSSDDAGGHALHTHFVKID